MLYSFMGFDNCTGLYVPLQYHVYYLVSFQVLAVMNKAAVNIHVQVFVCTEVFTSFG